MAWKFFIIDDEFRDRLRRELAAIRRAAQRAETDAEGDAALKRRQDLGAFLNKINALEDGPAELPGWFERVRTEAHGLMENFYYLDAGPWRAFFHLTFDAEVGLGFLALHKGEDPIRTLMEALRNKAERAKDQTPEYLDILRRFGSGSDDGPDGDDAE